MHEQAKIAGKSLSRYLALTGLSDEKKLPTKEEIEFIKDAIFQIRKIGTNLNQIAYVLHTTKRGTGTETTLEEITKTVREAENLIRKMKKLL